MRVAETFVSFPSAAHHELHLQSPLHILNTAQTLAGGLAPHASSLKRVHAPQCTSKFPHGSEYSSTEALCDLCCSRHDLGDKSRIATSAACLCQGSALYRLWASKTPTPMSFDGAASTISGLQKVYLARLEIKTRSETLLYLFLDQHLIMKIQLLLLPLHPLIISGQIITPSWYQPIGGK